MTRSQPASAKLAGRKKDKKAVPSGPAARGPQDPASAPAKAPPGLGKERAALLEGIRSMARRSGSESLAVEEFCRRANLSRRHVRRFGNWRDLCAAAGIAAARPTQTLSDDEIFGAMREAFIAAGGIVSIQKFERHFRYSYPIFRYRGMNWAQARAAFRAWAVVHAPDFPYLDKLPVDAPARPGRIDRRAATAALRSPAVSHQPALITPSAGQAICRQWPVVPGPQLGDLIKFRSLVHAPTNEQGVIYLFGMVAADLGYAVECFMTRQFPDCDGVRRVAGGKWQRVRVEFEFQSRNFAYHGHDPEKCDVIVCWEHNWPDCPLEVLELRAAIRALAQ